MEMHGKQFALNDVCLLRLAQSDGAHADTLSANRALGLQVVALGKAADDFRQAAESACN